jgi:SAM-dependent methyltransferase
MRPLPLVAVVLLACAPVHSPGGVSVATEPPTTRTRGPRLPPADAVAQTRAFFAALDRHDIATLDADLGAEVIIVDRGRPFDRDFLLESVRARRARNASDRATTCDDGVVRSADNVAVVVAECVVAIPAEGDDPARSVTTVNTIVWAHDGRTWRIASWQSEQGGPEATRALWNDTFRDPRGFSEEPNALLVETVAGRRPGNALDLMMGQGRNALHLAANGWDVTGIDLSDEGVQRARTAAARRGLVLETIVGDVDDYDLGRERWDLITLIYAGADARLIERAKLGLRPGGLFIVEYFARDTVIGENLAGIAEDQLAAAFPGWTILCDEVVEDVADWGLARQRVARFVAQKP